MKKGSVIRTVLLVAAATVFVYSSYRLITYFGESKKEKDLYEEVRKTVNGMDAETGENGQKDEVADPAADPEVEFPADRIRRKDNLQSVYEQNSDTIGWITIRDTAIDYPVMQSLEERDFYLKHDFEKKQSAFGCIYMDAGISLEGARNRMLYGHHMKDGSMFASLVKYDSIDYWKEHPVIEFDTLSALNDYRIIGAFKARGSDLEKIQTMLVMNTEEQFEQFKDFFEKNRFYDTGVDFSFDDEFITLMTCEYTYENGRFFVVGKLVRTDR